MQCSLFNILSMDKVSMSHLKISQDIKENISSSSYLDSNDVINFKIFLGLTSKAMTDREKKGEDENTKIRISRDRK